MEQVTIYTNMAIENSVPCVACIGFFDGIHRGHQKLIQKTVSLAAQKNLLPVCICFDEDPWVVMKKTKVAKHITPHEQRMHILQQLGIKRCYLLHFNHEMMHLSKEAFVQSILQPLSIDTLVCGEDFRFGAKGKGSIKELREAAFALNVVQEVQENGKKISSSDIENHIQQGNMEKVHELLGRPYTMEGCVVHGAKVGKKVLGFPTANLSVSMEYVMPQKGVYAGFAVYQGQKYRSMINIGHNPTMNFKEALSIEGYLLDFEGDLYGKTLSFGFYKMIREEKRFSSTEELILQLQEDVAFVASYKGCEKDEISII